MPFFSVLKQRNSVQLQSRSKMAGSWGWLEHGCRKYSYERQVFSFRKGGVGQKEARVIEDGLCYNKGYDDLIRICIHQHTLQALKTLVWGSDREDVYQYLQLTLT